MRSLSRSKIFAICCASLCVPCGCSDETTLPPPSPALTPAAELERSTGGAAGAGPSVDTPAAATAVAGDAQLAAAGFMAEVGGGLRKLVTVEWELPPATEQYLCARLTFPVDVYVKEFVPLGPRGTHHTGVTTLAEPDGPDGVTPCGVQVVGTRILYGSGPGTQPIALPPGVGAKLAAGEQLILNLHLFNASDQPLRGVSGTLIREVALDEVTSLADGLAAGPIRLQVPPGRSTVRGTCTLEDDATFFQITPHMHQTGVHMKTVAHSSLRGDVVLYDGAFDFHNQLTQPLDLLPMKAGDIVDIECTYENPSERTLSWGESSTDEMCLAGLGRFPMGKSSVCPR